MAKCARPKLSPLPEIFVATIFMQPDTSVFEVLMSKIDGRKVSNDVRGAIRIEAIQKWAVGSGLAEAAKNDSWFFQGRTHCLCLSRGFLCIECAHINN